jgi:hypothetical protein
VLNGTSLDEQGIDYVELNGKTYIDPESAGRLPMPVAASQPFPSVGMLKRSAVWATAATGASLIWQVGLQLFTHKAEALKTTAFWKEVGVNSMVAFEGWIAFDLLFQGLLRLLNGRNNG